MVLCSRCEREKIYIQYLQSIIKNKKKYRGGKQKGITVGKQRGYLQCRGGIWYLQWEYSFL